MTKNPELIAQLYECHREVRHIIDVGAKFEWLSVAVWICEVCEVPYPCPTIKGLEDD